MIQIIFNIVFLLILTSIIILNAGNTTTIDLFFRQFQDLSVVVVVFLSFILGVLYAFCYTVYWKIRKKLRGNKLPGKKGLKGEADLLPEEPPVPPLVP
ncbi:MAG: lipopolysaccharide assembly protein LapA domain-containing protein [Spirochaetales bacterium]|jgi:uncharacterized integral membrane protein|nr:lipopolysaccharide assembly protein LapA domain-containing protein [Spirochaetales bacterium]